MLWKEKFVKAWTNEFFHLGTTVTSYVEDAHLTLKANLQVSTGIFIGIVASNRIYLLIFAHNNPLYANIKGRVSIFALKKINEQYQKAAHATIQEPLPLCTKSFSKTMGLPCAHNIQHLDNNRSLIIDNIHKHWWIQGYSLVLQADENTSLHEDTLQPLLRNLQERYQEWPKFQQVAAYVTLDNMINAPLMVLQNLKVIPTKGRPS
ncbi:12083_t:CDS:2, partial [Funneliformis caledonium]